MTTRSMSKSVLVVLLFVALLAAIQTVLAHPGHDQVQNAVPDHHDHPHAPPLSEQDVELTEDGQEEMTMEDLEAEDIDAMRNNMANVVPGEGLDFKYVFPKNPFKAFPNRELAELLINVMNNGERKQTIFSVRGFLMHPMNDTQPVANLTAYRYTVGIAPGEQATVKYWFRPNTEAMEAPLHVVLDCFDEKGGGFQVSAFKDTIKITDAESMYDLQSFFLIALLSVVGLFVLYLSYESLLPSSGPGSKKGGSRGLAKMVEKVPEFVSSERKPSNDSAASTNQDNEWIPDHIMMMQKPGKIKKKNK